MGNDETAAVFPGAASEEEEADPEYIEAQNVIAAGITEEDVNRFLRRVHDRQSAIALIERQAKIAIAREAAELSKTLRFYGPSVEVWFAEYLAAKNRNKARLVKSQPFLYGTLKVTASGGRPTVSDPDAALRYIREHMADDDDTLTALLETSVNKQAVLTYFKQTGDLIDGVTVTPKVESVAVEFRGSGLKGVKVRVEPNLSGDTHESDDEGAE